MGRRPYFRTWSAADQPWYQRLERLHPELLAGKRRLRSLDAAEAIVVEATGLTLAQMYDMHPDVLEVLSGESLPTGFAEADSRTLSWPLACVRAWFDRPLLVRAGAERLASVVLDHLLRTGGDARDEAFFICLGKNLGPTYAASASMFVSACPGDIEPLDFVRYWSVVGRDAERMIRGGVPLEYAATLASD